MAEPSKMTGLEAEIYFKELQSRTVYTKTGHTFKTSKRNPWLNYCQRCGLVWSNNKSTQKAIKNGCQTWSFK